MVGLYIDIRSRSLSKHMHAGMAGKQKGGATKNNLVIFVATKCLISQVQIVLACCVKDFFFFFSFFIKHISFCYSNWFLMIGMLSFLLKWTKMYTGLLLAFAEGLVFGQPFYTLAFLVGILVFSSISGN